MNEKQLEKINKLLSLLKDDTITPKELESFIVLVLDVIKKAKTEFDISAKSQLEEIQVALEYIEAKTPKVLSSIEEKVKTSKAQIDSKVSDVIAYLDEVKKIKTTAGKNGKDGKDADEEEIIEKVIARIEIPQPKEPKELSIEEIVYQINGLPTDEDTLKIDASHIKNLPEVTARYGGSVARNLYQLLDVLINQNTLANNDIIKWDATNQTWVNGTATGGGGTPGGSNTQLQYNNSGVFGGISGVTTDGTAVTFADNAFLAHNLKASTSAGLLLESNSGTDVLLLGAGGGAGATFYGGVNFDTVTADRIAGFVGSKTLTSLDTATYPSLTELSYVKGATSNIQTQINALSGALTYYGTWNASTNTPTLTSSSGITGQYYVVSVAGSTNLDGITTWNVGDWAIFNGSVWERLINGSAVSSVTGTANRITSTGGVTPVIDIASTYVGQTSITTLGTIATGTWQGTAIANAYITNTLTGKTYNGVNLTTGGASTKYLSEDGTYTTPSGGGGGTPAGSTGEIQFNNAGAFGASSNLFWDNTNNRLGIGTSSPTSFLHQISPAQTALTASTESIDTHFNNARTVQFATGALTLQRSSVFSAPTYSFVGGSTLSDAATVAITGAPIEGTNATITRSYALFIQGGNAGAVGTAHGLGIIAPTGGGTNNIFSGFSSGSTEVFQIGASGITNIKVGAGALSAGTAILKLGTGTLSGSASGNALAVAEVIGFAGNLVAVQLNAANRFQVAATGVVTLANQTIWQTGIGTITHLLGPTDQNFTIASNTPASGTARTLILNGANATSAGAGGAITITGGNATNTSGANGGAISITSGNGVSALGSAQSGNITITTGSSGSSSVGTIIFRTNGANTRATISDTALTLADAINIVVGTTTGTKIATATSQKIGFWNATPIVQPTTAISAGAFTANTSGIADDSATFDGYTMGQVVAALRSAGLLA